MKTFSVQFELNHKFANLRVHTTPPTTGRTYAGPGIYDNFKRSIEPQNKKQLSQQQMDAVSAPSHPLLGRGNGGSRPPAAGGSNPPLWLLPSSHERRLSNAPSSTLLLLREEGAQSLPRKLSDLQAS